ncbi:MFS transporter [Nonomuraea sp. NPDC050691]|uniref:MFS transporter n=1 Tax=Nonomuraea sp. NPDC050691 TaxID=3155661 RepID=UPI003407E13E
MTGSRGRWAGLAVLSVSVLVVVMDMTVLNVALPAITEDLWPDAVQVLWMVDVYALVLAGLLVTLGALGDRWGRRRLLRSGFAVFGTASAAVLAADGPEAVIAVRALLGVGGAMIMPSTLSMIRHLFPDPRERATALGVWTAMAAVGGALGPVLGGLLLERLSWRAAFLVNVPVMAVALVAGLLLLPESRNPAPGRWDVPGAVLSFAGMVALVYAVKHAGAGGGAFDGVTLSAGVFAVAALATSVAMTGTLLLLAQWLQLVGRAGRDRGRLGRVRRLTGYWADESDRPYGSVRLPHSARHQRLRLDRLQAGRVRGPRRLRRGRRQLRRHR